MRGIIDFLVCGALRIKVILAPLTRGAELKEATKPLKDFHHFGNRADQSKLPL